MERIRDPTGQIQCDLSCSRGTRVSAALTVRSRWPLLLGGTVSHQEEVSLHHRGSGCFDRRCGVDIAFLRGRCHQFDYGLA